MKRKMIDVVKAYNTCPFAEYVLTPNLKSDYWTCAIWPKDNYPNAQNSNRRCSINDMKGCILAATYKGDHKWQQR